MIFVFISKDCLQNSGKGLTEELEQAFPLPHDFREVSAAISGFYSFSFERNDISIGLIQVIRLNKMLIEKFEEGTNSLDIYISKDIFIIYDINK